MNNIDLILALALCLSLCVIAYLIFDNNLLRRDMYYWKQKCTEALRERLQNFKID